MSDVETVDEEVAFWRGFIEWWAREKDEPVPPRAWEALDYAERKGSAALDEWQASNETQKAASMKPSH
jgi:hypothetical protein